jgi:hypothetical protein
LSQCLDRAAQQFFSELEGQGTMARAGFALFVPEGTVHRRRIKEFRENLDAGVRRAAPIANLTYQAGADRVFFLGEQSADHWKTPEGGGAPEVLAREFLNGTPTGWTILHAYWGQLNHLLLSGDAAFLHSLPGSLRADLAEPLVYVLRVDVAYEEERGVTTHAHRIDFHLVETGTERPVCSRSYPLVLSARITD